MQPSEETRRAERVLTDSAFNSNEDWEQCHGASAAELVENIC